MNGQRVQLFTYAVYNTCKYSSVRNMNKIADWNSSIRPRHYSYPFGYSFIRYFEELYFSWFVAFVPVSNRDFISFSNATLSNHVITIDPTHIIATIEWNRSALFLFRLSIHKNQMTNGTTNGTHSNDHSMCCTAKSTLSESVCASSASIKCRREL